jgi:hypothetical protein
MTAHLRLVNGFDPERREAGSMKAGTTYERLLTEDEAIDALGLHGRKNPRGALRWLIRQKRLGCVRLGRGIISFRPADIDAFINAHHENLGA